MQPVIFQDRLATNYDVSFQERAYINSLADEYFKREEKEKENLLTKEDVLARRKKVQAAFKKAVGKLPDRYAPLNVNFINEHVLSDGVIIKNLTYESLPDLLVTATLWLPKNYDNGEKYPAAILGVGHSPVGRAHDTYTILARMLARNGIVVLCADPPGQFERVQYPGDGASRIGGAVAEHFQMGFPCHLTGLTLASFFIRDLERGFDLLETLPYVDKERLSITGNSGGGLMSAYMALWDDRIVAAAPACFITTRKASLSNGRPMDPEQIVPRVIKEGINHDDFIALIAPKPHLICTARFDPVDIGGAFFTHERAKKIYRLFGAEENARFYSAPTGHGLYEGQREAITRFLCDVLNAPVKEVDVTQVENVQPDLLRATKTGFLLTDGSSKSIFDCYNEYYKKNGYTDCSREELKSRALKLLSFPMNLEERPPLKYPRFLSDEIIDGVRIRRTWFFSEGETSFDRRIAVCGCLMSSCENPKKCVILIQDDQNDTQYYEKLLKEGNAVYLFYPRGIGAAKSLDAPNITVIKSSVGSILSPEYRRNCDAVMCGTSLASLRTYDALRAFDFMKTLYEDVSFAGVKKCALYALLAAAVSETTACVFDPPAPYSEFVENIDYDRNEREEVFGILEYFDIPLLIDKLRRN